MTATLESLVTADRVVIRSPAATWREAIAASAVPLIDDGSITGAYVEAMIAAVEKFGPYIVLGPHIALAHARPDSGVNRQAMSLLTLAQPVEFGHADHDPVEVVICLASPDSSSHLQALKSFVKLATDTDRVQALAQSTTVEQVRDLLRS